MASKKPGLKCKHCGDEIFSNHRHDFKKCKCEKIFVDGGDSYFRYGGNPGDFQVIYKDSANVKPS